LRPGSPVMVHRNPVVRPVEPPRPRSAADGPPGLSRSPSLIPEIEIPTLGPGDGRGRMHPPVPGRVRVPSPPPPAPDRVPRGDADRN